jgi:hypothetical protein
MIAEAEEKSGYPDWWDFDPDGDGPKIAGDFVRAGRGHTQNGEKTFVVLLVDGVERTVWLHHDVLVNQFARELHRRSDKKFQVGERIEITRLGMRDSQSGGSSYMNYATVFVDGPEVRQEDIFGPPPDGQQHPQQPQEPQQPSAASSGPDDDIAFKPAA